MGHAISYNEVNLVETKLADDQAQIVSREFIPTIIQNSSFVTFVFDNCDHNMESIYGATLHCTNGIIIQVKAQENAIPSICQSIEVASQTRYSIKKKAFILPNLYRVTILLQQSTARAKRIFRSRSYDKST